MLSWLRREIKLGRWEGQEFKTVKNEDPQALQAWIDDPVKKPPPGGEGLAEFQNRVISAFNEILAEKYERTAVVSHGGVIRVYLVYILDMPLVNYQMLSPSNTGVTKITFNNGSPSLRFFNCTHHLKD